MSTSCTRRRLHPHSRRSLPRVKMHGSGGGNWLIRHHRRPRKRTYHPDWKSTELSHFEVEPYKAMFYEESK
eukprot:5903609-Prorocentrum_lima.AAC.1